MSDFRAIGGVSATLQTLIRDRMEFPDGVPDAPVTIGPPPFSAKDSEQRKEDARLNLFLYRVTENGNLQNQEIPGRGSNGYGHPPLSLNLHYLLTAYGNTELNGGATALFDDTNAHFLLGSAMRVLHDFPIVTDQLTAVRPPSGGLMLHPSLRDAYEKVRLSLEPLTLEDVTKVWTALALRYRLSAAYVVNVVQVESRRTRPFPRPVGQPARATPPPLATDPPSPGPWIYALTMQTPTITEVHVRRLAETTEQPFPYARVGDTLVLRGTSLSGPETSVRFGDVELPASLASPVLVEAVVPDALAGTTLIPEPLRLQPGVRTVQVVTRDPQVPHSAFTSNEAAFMLVPTVDPTRVVLSVGSPRTLTIEGDRLVGPTPGGETVIGRSVVERSAYLLDTAQKLVVPVPTSLPVRDVTVLVGATLADPVPIGNTAHTLRIDIGGTVKNANAPATLPSNVPRDSVARILTALVRDAAPEDPHFAGARAELHDDRLVVVSGDLASPVSITSPGAGTFAAALGLTATPGAGDGSAAMSGALSPLPVLTASSPRLQVTVGALPPVVVTVDPFGSLSDLALGLQPAVRAASAAPAYAALRVLTIGSQLLVIPGTAATVTFAAPAGDPATVAELRLHALFPVRVRANGAESTDLATVELPQ
ncbi:MAG: DUF4255 domain-containing protein [Nocardioides sp.]|nr:DUF4255 domain-containing protein [Nocardioides sp.]